MRQSQILSGGVISAAGDIISNGGNLRAGGDTSHAVEMLSLALAFLNQVEMCVFIPPIIRRQRSPTQKRKATGVFSQKGELHASPNTAWWNGSQMVWRCGSTGAMRMSAVVGGCQTVGASFPSVFPNACRVVSPNPK